LPWTGNRTMPMERKGMRSEEESRKNNWRAKERWFLSVCIKPQLAIVFCSSQLSAGCRSIKCPSNGAGRPLIPLVSPFTNSISGLFGSFVAQLGEVRPFSKKRIQSFLGTLGKIYL
jgi:hypothetical protein